MCRSCCCWFPVVKPSCQSWQCIEGGIRRTVGNILYISQQVSLFYRGVCIPCSHGLVWLRIDRLSQPLGADWLVGPLVLVKSPTTAPPPAPSPPSPG